MASRQPAARLEPLPAGDCLMGSGGSVSHLAGVQGHPPRAAALVVMGYLGLWTRRVNRFRGVSASEQERHLLNGVPFHNKSLAINPRRNRCNNGVDLKRP